MSDRPRIRGFKQPRPDDIVEVRKDNKGETVNTKPEALFVPATPEISSNWQYGEPVPDRERVGRNVQRDHVPPQSVMKQMVGPDHDPNVLTVLQETGKATSDRPALPHTQATHADVRHNKNLKAELEAGRQPFLSDLIAETRQPRIHAGFGASRRPGVGQRAWDAGTEVPDGQACEQACGGSKK